MHTAPGYRGGRPQLTRSIITTDTGGSVTRRSAQGVRPEFLTTLHYPKRAEWVHRGECVTTDQPGRLVRLARVVCRARRGQPVVLNGFDRADVLAGMVLARVRGVPVVVLDSTWKRGRNWFDRHATRLGVRLLAGPRTTFCVSSEAEAAVWPQLWGVPADRLAVLHWYHGVEEPERTLHDGDGTIFAGGHALRDYATLLAAADQVDAPITIAARAADVPGSVSAPHNVTVTQLPLTEFHRRLATASAVVVPLEDGQCRSAGQTTYLDAMALGGLVVVSDTIGVREHIEHGRTGFICRAGDADELGAIMRWALDPANTAEMRAIRSAARRVARDHFAPERFISTALDIIERSTQVPKTRS